MACEDCPEFEGCGRCARFGFPVSPDEVWCSRAGPRAPGDRGVFERRESI